MLIGFGGPENPEEVRRFLESVLEGVKISSERLEEVLSHYAKVGGISPFNKAVYRQRETLADFFKKNKSDLPVVVGFRHSHHSLEEVFLDLKKNSIDQVISVILSSFRCYASFEKYQEKILEAQEKTGSKKIQVFYTENFASHPDFIKIQSERILEVINTAHLNPETTYYLFSAHSIPQKMPGAVSYASQFQEASRRVAEQCGLKNWGLAYQSRSGRLEDAWLGPDISKSINRLKNPVKTIVLIPIGFLCDNVEILYDLDIETRALTEKKGLKYIRTQSLMDHSSFTQLLDTLIQQTREGFIGTA